MPTINLRGFSYDEYVGRWVNYDVEGVNSWEELVDYAHTLGKDYRPIILNGRYTVQQLEPYTD